MEKVVNAHKSLVPAFLPLPPCYEFLGKFDSSWLLGDG